LLQAPKMPGIFDHLVLKSSEAHNVDKNDGYNEAK
jgi:hypothetical protein